MTIIFFKSIYRSLTYEQFCVSGKLTAGLKNFRLQLKNENGTYVLRRKSQGVIFLSTGHQCNHNLTIKDHEIRFLLMRVQFDRLTWKISKIQTLENIRKEQTKS